MQLDQKLAEEKAIKVGFSSDLSRLQEINRQYAKTVHQLSQEIHKNEMLQDKLNSIQKN